MAQELYNLHSDGDHYRITKFVDGEVEASYLLTETECECPAGHRPSCRHRQMLPQMLHNGILNTPWFLIWSPNLQGKVVDFEGNEVATTNALAEGIAPVAPAPETVLELPPAPAQPWRRF